jgi:undecaprenyl diphosphate synthase
MQSESPPPSAGLHLAIIMDGNGRWATRRGLPRVAGHRVGATAVRRVVEAAPGLGATTLTLFAFAAANWRRPESEVSTLMRLFAAHLRDETPKLAEAGVRLSVIGRRDRLGAALRDGIAVAEAATAAGRRMHLRIAIDYSAREAIARAAERWDGAVPVCPTRFGRLVSDVPDVDLLIRTGGERRMSDFLLWEAAQAELYFTDCMWPDFDADALREALADFHARERRFGGLGVAA